jgi:hypothetical protein
MWSHHPAGSLPLFWVTLDPDICIPPLKETEGPKGYQSKSNESRITNSLIATYCDKFKLMTQWYAAFPLYAWLFAARLKDHVALTMAWEALRLLGMACPTFLFAVALNTVSCQGMSSSVSSAKNLRHTSVAGMLFV